MIAPFSALGANVVPGEFSLRYRLYSRARGFIPQITAEITIIPHRQVAPTKLKKMILKKPRTPVPEKQRQVRRKINSPDKVKSFL
jgi:hypothetical protein